MRKNRSNLASQVGLEHNLIYVYTIQKKSSKHTECVGFSSMVCTGDLSLKHSREIIIYSKWRQFRKKILIPNDHKNGLTLFKIFLKFIKPYIFFFKKTIGIIGISYFFGLGMLLKLSLMNHFPNCQSVHFRGNYTYVHKKWTILLTITKKFNLSKY